MDEGYPRAQAILGSSYASQGQAATSIPSFELPPPPLSDRTDKYTPFDGLKAGSSSAPTRSLSSVGNLRTPPNTLPAEVPSGLESELPNSSRGRYAPQIPAPIPAYPSHWIPPAPYGHPSIQQNALPVDRPFKCDQCEQSFNRNHDLKRHKRMHLAVKPYPCGHCDKSFSRKDALKRHMLVRRCGQNKRPEVSTDHRPPSPVISEPSVPAPDLDDIDHTPRVRPSHLLAGLRTAPKIANLTPALAPYNQSQHGDRPDAYQYGHWNNFDHSTTNPTARAKSEELASTSILHKKDPQSSARLLEWIPDAAQTERSYTDPATGVLKITKPEFTGHLELEKSLAMLYLWGDGIEDGKLDYCLSFDIDLKDVVMENLCLIAKALLEAHSIIPPTTQLRTSKKLIDELRLLLDAVDTGSSDAEEDAQLGPDDLDGLLISLPRRLDVLTRALLDLSPTLEQLYDSVTEDKGREVSETFHTSLKVSQPAFQWVSMVRDSYTNADSTLVERLGEANWQRFMRMREQETIEPAERQAFQSIPAQSIFQPVSKFQDSGLGSSKHTLSHIAPTVASHTSFLTTASEKDSGRLRVPKKPDRDSFECFICHHFVTRMNTRPNWKMHVFEDLQPYICTFGDCSSAVRTFATRAQWAKHEFSQHRDVSVFRCQSCSEELLNVKDFQNHQLRKHNASLSQMELENAAASAHIIRPQRVDEQTCPLCFSTNHQTPQKFISHVCRHMEQIALAALPPDNDSDSESDAKSLDGSNSDRLSLPRFELNDEHKAAIDKLESMGFSRDSAELALRASSFNFDSAVEYLLFGKDEPLKAGHRVKVYELREDEWYEACVGLCFADSVRDCGYISVLSEMDPDDMLRDIKIEKDALYTRQQADVIVSRQEGKEVALSFQEIEGCSAIWNCIEDIQQKLSAQTGRGRLLESSDVQQPTPVRGMTGCVNSATGEEEVPKVETDSGQHIDETSQEMLDCSSPSYYRREDQDFGVANGWNLLPHYFDANGLSDHQTTSKSLLKPTTNDLDDVNTPSSILEVTHIPSHTSYDDIVRIIAAHKGFSYMERNEGSNPRIFAKFEDIASATVAFRTLHSTYITGTPKIRIKFGKETLESVLYDPSEDAMTLQSWLHGCCTKCQYVHSMAKFTVSTDGRAHNVINCRNEGCGIELLGIGGKGIYNWFLLKPDIIRISDDLTISGYQHSVNGLTLYVESPASLKSVNDKLIATAEKAKAQEAKAEVDAASSDQDEEEKKKREQEEEERLIAEMEIAEREEEEREKVYTNEMAKEHVETLGEEAARKKKKVDERTEEEIKRAEREAENVEEARFAHQSEYEDTEEAKAEQQNLFASLRKAALGPGAEPLSGPETLMSDDSMSPPHKITWSWQNTLLSNNGSESRRAKVARMRVIGACETCRARKVACNVETPCSNCSKLNIECIRRNDDSLAADLEQPTWSRFSSMEDNFDSER